MPECTHLDHVHVTQLPESVDGCEECLARRHPVAAPAHLPGVRARRLLRRLAQQARDEARAGRRSTRSSGRSSRARTGPGASPTSCSCGSTPCRARRASRRRRCSEADVDDPVLQQRFAAGYEEPAAVEERLGRVLRADTQEMPAVVPSAEHPSWALLIEGGASPAPAAATPRGRGARPHRARGRGTGARRPRPRLRDRPRRPDGLAPPRAARGRRRRVPHPRPRLDERHATRTAAPVTSTRLHEGDTVTFGLHVVQLVWG